MEPERDDFQVWNLLQGFPLLIWGSRGCHRYIPLRMAGFCRGADDKSLGWMVDQGVWWMKLSVDQDDVFIFVKRMVRKCKFQANSMDFFPVFGGWWCAPPIKKVSETSLPSFSNDALMHDHWKGGSRLSHTLDWSLAQQHISVQFTSIHSFAGINDAQNKNMELFFQCFSVSQRNSAPAVVSFHMSKWLFLCLLHRDPWLFQAVPALDLLCDKWQMV